VRGVQVRLETGRRRGTGQLVGGSGAAIIGRVMPWVIAVLIGVGTGTLSGLAASSSGLRPIIQSAASAVTALLIATVAMSLVWYSSPGVVGGYFVVGLDNLLNVAAFLAVVLALHLLLGLLPGMVSENRPIILGAIGGLSGALPMAWMMVIASRLQ
jgi:hypothetical protein